MLQTQGHFRKPSGADNAAPNYTFPGILHFLQQEWRRFERERNDWEIERAELKARVMVLEGECRGHESAQVNLVRRIKMLEHALRTERKRYASPDVFSAPDNEKGQSPITPTANTSAPEQPIELMTNGPLTKLATSTTKSRLKSRDLLKLCLQEVDQLSTFSTEQISSATAVNAASAVAAATSTLSLLDRDELMGMAATGARPVHARGQPGGVMTATAAVDASVVEQLQHPPPLVRDESILTEGRLDALLQGDGPPTVRLPRTATTTITMIDVNKAGSPPPPPPQGSHVRRTRRPSNPTPDDQPGVRSPPLLQQQQPQQSRILDGTNAFADTGDAAGSRKRQTMFLPADVDVMAEGAEPTHTTGEAPRSPSLVGVKVDEIDDVVVAAPVLEDQPSSPVSQRGNGQRSSSSGMSTTHKRYASNGHRASDYYDDDVVAFGVDSSTANCSSESDANQKLWKLRIQLRSHLDAVRALDFHRDQMTLATGGEDGLVKIWDVADLSPTPSKVKEYEPRITLRGHLGAVHAIQVSNSQQRCFSAGADATIMVWQLPSDFELYAPYDPHVLQTKYIGHSDIIWDMRLQPTAAGDMDQRQWIATAAADGTVKLWDTCGEGSPLRISFGYEGAECGDGELARDILPTSVDFCQQRNQVVVGYVNATLRLFDIETGKMLLHCPAPSTYDGTSNSQVNRVVASPTASLVAAVYEDRHLRLFDMNSNQYVHTVAAHADAASALDVSASGELLMTGGHDCSVRLWDLRSLSCLQELRAHRRKLDEGVLCVRMHPTAPWLASGGADSQIKLYS